MKLIITEYIRSLKERDELDRLLPDLLLEMGYVLIERPQTGNRQFGVDIAVRSSDDNANNELMLFVVKQGDISRNDWDSGPNSVRQSITEIFDVYLRLHLEPQDQNRKLRVIVATSGELKQTVRPAWCGVVEQYKEKAKIEFWGADTLAFLTEEHLLNEHIFLNEDRHDFRRALALSGDSEYDREELHRIFSRSLDLTPEGTLNDTPKHGKALLKAMRVVCLAARMYAHWTLQDDGDSRQGLQAIERAMLWIWHRVQLGSEKETSAILNGPLSSLWLSYIQFSKSYFQRIQPYCYVLNSLQRSPVSHGLESSLVAFEQMGILASMALFQLSLQVGGDNDIRWRENANVLTDGLIGWIENNGVCASPCLDRHSQDITLAMIALCATGRTDYAKEWLRILFRNIDFAYKSKCYVPATSESLDDLVQDGGWTGEKAKGREMEMSWTIAVLAGWCVVLGEEELYCELSKNANEEYPDICVQLWHPESDVYQHLYFQPAHSFSGVTEAPIKLPAEFAAYKQQLDKLIESDFGKVISKSPTIKYGLYDLDFIAFRHFKTPIPPAFWYSLMRTEFISGN